MFVRASVWASLFLGCFCFAGALCGFGFCFGLRFCFCRGFALAAVSLPAFPLRPWAWQRSFWLFPGRFGGLGLGGAGLFYRLVGVRLGFGLAGRLYAFSTAPYVDFLLRLLSVLVLCCLAGALCGHLKVQGAHGRQGNGDALLKAVQRLFVGAHRPCCAQCRYRRTRHRHCSGSPCRCRTPVHRGCSPRAGRG